MKQKLLLLLLPLLLGVSVANAQQKPKFSIVSLEQDKFDGTAKNKQYEKVDGNGARYAIIKVTSATPDDDLRAYRFNFGNLNSLVEEHDGELWVYVQRNAKMVTITREGYSPINKYDLNLTIEAGETYNMRLSSAGKVVNYQMVMFSLKPTTANAIIMVKGNQQGAKEELFGTTDDSGMTAKSLEYGTYTYRVIADNYHLTEGRLILDDKTKTHIEDVLLKSNHAEIILSVDADADIYINKEKRGTREWKGILKAGTYEITCRQEGHQPSTRFITVEENTNQTVALTPPTPITGELSITSRPLGAAISIDGQEYGQTPRIINDLLIGQHTVTLTKDNYNAETQSFEVKEGEMTEIKAVLTQMGDVATQPQKAENTNMKIEVSTPPLTKTNKNYNRIIFGYASTLEKFDFDQLNSDPNILHGFDVGWTVGFNVTKRMRLPLYLETGLHMAFCGFGNVNYLRLHFTVPISVTYRYTIGHSKVCVAPYLGIHFKVNALTQTISYYDGIRDDGHIKHFQMGMQVGVNFDIKHFNVGFGWDNDFSSLYDNGNYARYDIKTIKTSGVRINIGVVW